LEYGGQCTREQGTATETNGMREESANDMDSAGPGQSVEKVAIIVNPRDNVATARVPVAKGTSLSRDGRVIRIGDDIPFGHKFALHTIREGEFVIKFGDPIGRAQRDIAPGDSVHIHNLESCRGRGSQAECSSPGGSACQGSTGLPEGAATGEPNAHTALAASRTHAADELTFLGFRRPDGSVGVRNHMIVLPSVACAGHVAELIARELSRCTKATDVIAIGNQHGCSQLGMDREQTLRTLVGTAASPNVGAALIVGLGCETISAREIAEEVSHTQKPVEAITIQELGGTGGAVKRGVEVGRAMLRAIESLDREPVGIGELILGTECGGSDTCSGFSANPAVGHASDLLIQHGGTVVLAETTEFIGAEHLLWRRAATRELGDRIVAMTKRVEQSAIDLGVDLLGANPAPGNIAGGITTIEEKSLGCIYKSGTAPIHGAFAYGERIRGKGLVIMDTPGNDVVSLTGMAAGGVHLAVFTTGRGTPAGAPIIPVIKISTNSGLFARMGDNLDINAGTIIDGQETIEEVGRRIFERVVAVASGQQTRAERWGHREYSIGRIAPTF
jgi:altronate dehydratase large subunit